MRSYSLHAASSHLWSGDGLVELLLYSENWEALVAGEAGYPQLAYTHADLCFRQQNEILCLLGNTVWLCEQFGACSPFRPEVAGSRLQAVDVSELLLHSNEIANWLLKPVCLQVQHTSHCIARHLLSPLWCLSTRIDRYFAERGGLAGSGLPMVHRPRACF